MYLRQRRDGTATDDGRRAPSTLPGSGCWQDRARNRILFNANHDASAAGSTGLDPVCASDFRDSVEEACKEDLRTCWQLSANDECRRLNYKGASRVTIGDDDLPKDIQCTDTKVPGNGRSCQLTGNNPSCITSNGQILDMRPKVCDGDKRLDPDTGNCEEGPLRLLGRRSKLQNQPCPDDLE